MICGLFFFRKSKRKAGGPSPVFVRVTVNGERFELSTARVERLAIARDIFVFSCYTGLAYSDVEKLTPSDIATGLDGEKWIFTTRTKTYTPTRVPLLPTAMSILERYEKHQRVEIFGKALPVFSNQKLNGYLKEIADMCDVRKELSFHCARHTFATTVTLTNGVPIETVSKMLGHKNIRTTQIYAKIVDRKVSEDMMVLRDKLASMYDEASPEFAQKRQS